MIINSTIQELFQRNIKSEIKSGITFIDSPNKTEYISYKKLYLEATYLLYDLQQNGLKSGDELVFQFQSNKNFLITFWACVFGKIIPVPITFGVSLEVVNKINNVWKKLENPYLITDLQNLPTILLKFNDQNKNDTLKEIVNKSIIYQKPTYTKQVLPLPAKPSDIVFIQFSSGSTGVPKGVTNRQESIIHNLHNSYERLDIKNADKFLGWMPLTHDMGLVFFHLLPLVANVSQYLLPSIVFLTYPEFWIKSLANNEITISGSPNFGYKYALDNLNKVNLENLSFKNLRIMINSAEPVSVKLCQKFTETLAPYGFNKNVICPSYGLAEAVLGVSISLENNISYLKEYYFNREKLKVGDKIEFLDRNHNKSASFADLGLAVGTDIKITNTEKQTLPENTLGHIHLKSNAVTTGYYNAPEETKKVLSEDGWLDTGDLGILCNGHLIITGRVKEMILIKGQNYFPNDIDKVIEELPSLKFQQVASCNIFNEESYQDEIFIFVIYDSSIKEFVNIANAIRRHVRKRIGLGVKKIIKVDKIQKTTSGKIQRYLLRDNFFNGVYDDFLKQFDYETKVLKPQITKLSKVGIEEKIIEIVREILNTDNITSLSNFFDLGLTSLQIMQLKGSIESYIDKDLDTVSIFTYTTGRDLAAFIYNDLLENDLTISKTEQSKPDLSSAKERMKRLMKS